MKGESDIFDGRILLYDIQGSRAFEVSDRLRERGYLCTTVSSSSDCVKKINSGEFNILFLGQVEDNMGLFEVIEHAQNNGVEVSSYPFDHPDTRKLTNKLVRYIESVIIVLDHRRR